MPLPRPGLPLLIAGLVGATPAAGQTACATRAAAAEPVGVELYTSEGCSSCPPADRWLSTLKGRDGVFPLAFHVDYWDRLGWTDRFASPAWTRRQYDAAARRRSAAVYTPQVLVNGAEHRRWPALPTASAPSVVALSLQRDGETYRARVNRLPGAPARLAGYWAVTEDGLRSDVRAGENAGAALRHDFVVRAYEPVAEWDAAPGRPVTLGFTPPPAVAAGPGRTVNFVVVEAATGHPLQAARLPGGPAGACAG
jgi:hypothetical protein